MMRNNKLEGLPLEILSNQVLKQTQLEDLSDASFLGASWCYQQMLE
jgi:hypothetical protein